MGLDVNGVKFLLLARREGVSFASTATLGRQELLLDSVALAELLDRFGQPTSSKEIRELYSTWNGYSEGLFQVLGASEVTSFDASTYEGVSVTHDFNFPIPDTYKNRFSVVLDGGTLEHIFNFPQAVSNCMNMVAEGGHFLGITPTNNHSGHGFYQFSPELFFRIFSEANGFHLEHLIAFEETEGCPWYEVTDPKHVGERVSIQNNVPTMLLVIAKKVKTAELFENPPQQSDYIAVWESKTEATEPSSTQEPSKPNRIRAALRTPVRVLRRLKMRADRNLGMLNKRRGHFKKLDI